MPNNSLDTDRKLIQIIRRNSFPLEPLPTEAEFTRGELKHVHAVLFDVYGTLFISASGDIGAAREMSGEEPFLSSFRSASIVLKGPRAAEEGKKTFFGLISRYHEQGKERGILYPEVDIVRVWNETCSHLYENGLCGDFSEERIKILSVEYETRVNPVWQMADLSVLFSRLRRMGLGLGIVSNAQFYTPLLFPALTGGTLEDHGFQKSSCIWSYEHLEAKPSGRLFQLAVSALSELYSILPENILYVGNDMLNDIFAARSAGLRTALFAGDRRSLRLRKDHSSCKDVRPDVILTELEQLEAVLI